MKITRMHRAVFLILMMVFTSFYVWLTWSHDVRLFSFEELICVAIMLIGACYCIHGMKFGLKRMLSRALIVLGIYVFAKVALMLTMDPGIAPTLGIVIGTGCLSAVSILLGVTIWLGYDYNIIRVRMCMLIIAATAGVMCFVEGRFATDVSSWLDVAHIYFVVILLSLAFAFVTMDPSMDIPTMASGAKDNIVSMRRRMISVEDAYILRTEADSIRKHIDSKEPEPLDITVRSNDSMQFRLVFRNKENGERIVEVRDMGKVFVSTLFSVIYSDVVFGEDHISFYGEKGRSLKVLVFDEEQENMNLPMIFGRQLNIQKKD